MSESKLINAALKVIEGYKNNNIVMSFVKQEAFLKIGSDIKTEVCTQNNLLKENCHIEFSDHDIQTLIDSHESFQIRFDEYVNLGLLGCYINSIKKGK